MSRDGALFTAESFQPVMVGMVSFVPGGRTTREIEWGAYTAGETPLADNWRPNKQEPAPPPRARASPATPRPDFQ